MSEPNSPSDSSLPTKSNRPNRLRTVLFTILALMVVAVAYDFLYARKQQQAAAARLDKLMSVSASGEIESAEPHTQDEVRKTVGRPPSEQIEDRHYLLETYRWRSGLPWRTHDIHVAYTRNEPPALYSVFVGRPPEDHELPGMVRFSTDGDENSESPPAEEGT